jgi:hypothetical protein
VSIPLNTQVTVLLVSGEQVDGEVAMTDQSTYLCIRRDSETLYLPWTAIKCVRGPALQDRPVGGATYAANRLPDRNPDYNPG